MRTRVLSLSLSIVAGCARGGEASPEPPVVVPAQPAPVVAKADAGGEVGAVGDKSGGPIDLVNAPRVALRAAPIGPAAPKPIGAPPAKARRLKEIARVADTTANERVTANERPYDPKRINEIRGTPAKLPEGARPDIPLAYEGEPLETIDESGGKLLLVYGPRYVAVVGKQAEAVLDMDPPELPLDKEDRSFSDVHHAAYLDGVAYVCRGYNASIRSRKGYVTAVDVATGELRWRSPAQTCGGIAAVLSDYVITGYGEDVMPYALKLLRRSDGGVVQSIKNYGAALDFLVDADGSRVVVETFKHRITYALE